MRIRQFTTLNEENCCMFDEKHYDEEKGEYISTHKGPAFKVNGYQVICYDCLAGLLEVKKLLETSKKIKAIGIYWD